MNPIIDLTAANEADEEIADSGEDYETALRVTAIIAAVEIAQQSRIEIQHHNRLYPRRSQLLPDPRGDTPWQRLYNSQNNRAFITTMGFDVDTFGYILTSGFCMRRSDTNSIGDPRPDRRSLDTAGALGLVLHYLNSTMCEISLQQIFAIIPSTASRYINFGFCMLGTSFLR
ncbi:hypothetical protein J3R83DRAFT_1022 [Lanmaoa asiatica]|nr:hypothetical protein J3R83DRAFT_1022 [Lanmaoa asiatica]